MDLKIFPVYEVNNQTSHIFNRSERLRIMSMFTSWTIPDRDLFGPYELIGFTLLEPYQEGLSLKPYSICLFSREFDQIIVKLISQCEVCPHYWLSVSITE